MEAISIFDIFKIGVGPSSSHTLGPWKAALEFVDSIKNLKVDKIQIHLYGSLSKTGVGHATDKAVVLGLLGYHPKTINTDSIDNIISSVQTNQRLMIGDKELSFSYADDIIFEKVEHPLHPNTLKFKVFSNSNLVSEHIYASVGGGFIDCDNIHNES
jgi:L-serine dehydratase